MEELGEEYEEYSVEELASRVKKVEEEINKLDKLLKEEMKKVDEVLLDIRARESALENPLNIIKELGVTDFMVDTVMDKLTDRINEMVKRAVQERLSSKEFGDEIRKLLDGIEKEYRERIEALQRERREESKSDRSVSTTEWAPPGPELVPFMEYIGPTKPVVAGKEMVEALYTVLGSLTAALFIVNTYGKKGYSRVLDYYEAHGVLPRDLRQVVELMCSLLGTSDVPDMGNPSALDYICTLYLFNKLKNSKDSTLEDLILILLTLLCGQLRGSKQ